MPAPVYSHGGPAMQGFPAIVGNVASAGNPIQITNTKYEPAMHVFFSGTSCTVFIECNGGLVDPITGFPPAGEWVDYSIAGGFSLTNGQNLAKALPKTLPYWRTRIGVIVAGILVSYVPAIVVGDGNLVSAGRPSRTANPYNPNA